MMVEVSVGEDFEAEAEGFWGVFGGVVVIGSGLSCL